MKSEIIAVAPPEYAHTLPARTLTLSTSRKINELGVTVAFKTIVGDRRKEPGQLPSAPPLAALTLLCSWAAFEPTKTTSPAKPSPKRSRSPCAATLRRWLLWYRPRRHLAHPHAERQSQAGPTFLRARTLLPNLNAAPPDSGSTFTWQSYRKLLMLVPGPPTSAARSSTPSASRACAKFSPPATSPSAPSRAAMIPESQADKLLAPIYTEYKGRGNHHPGHAGDIQLTLLLRQVQRRHCSASASTSWPAAWKKPSKTGSTPPAMNLPNLPSLWSRSSFTISAFAKPRWP